MVAEPLNEAVDPDAVVDERLLLLLKAMSDPRRLAILRLLQDGAYCNCELGQELGLAPNLISHHLKVLREAGLVNADRHPADARWILYSLSRETLEEARGLCGTLLDPDRIGMRVPASCLTLEGEGRACGVARSL